MYFITEVNEEHWVGLVGCAKPPPTRLRAVRLSLAERGSYLLAGLYSIPALLFGWLRIGLGVSPRHIRIAGGVI